MKGRILMILMFILLFVGALIIFDAAINNSSLLSSEKKMIIQDFYLHQEGGVFSRMEIAETYNEMPPSQRSMDKYYENRAYPGAPPMITHPLLSEKGIGGKDCLQCHQNGGYVNQFKAFSPISPHPEWLNCRQCHLPQTTPTLFKNTSWQKIEPPSLGSRALATSPLIMPHGIQNRENCLSCHAGPGSALEIRVSHPERINCKQCHVPREVDQIYYSPVEERIGLFYGEQSHSDSLYLLDDGENRMIIDWIKNKETHIEESNRN